MAGTESVEIDDLRVDELGEADRIVRIAFGTFLGAPKPETFMGDRHFLRPRWGAEHVQVLAARAGGRLIGSNVLTRWGSFGFFGPLTVLPDYWDRGVASRLMEATVAGFDAWGVRHTGLFTFAHSAKHVGLYQKFGYWPRYLTAILTRTPEAGSSAAPALLSTLSRSRQEQALAQAAELTHTIDAGLDLTAEMRATLSRQTGETLPLFRGRELESFALCLHGPGSEGGEKTAYVKFAAARPGPGAGERFQRLLAACDAYAAARGLALEAGVNLAREDAFHRMRAHGYRVAMQGVAMQRPHGEGFNRPDVYLMDDWR